MSSENPTYDADSYSTQSHLTIHQGSDRIFHNPAFAYDEVETCGTPRLEGASLSVPLVLASGISTTLEITVLDAAVLRVFLRSPGNEAPFPARSDMLVSFSGTVPTLDVKPAEDGWILEFGPRRVFIGSSPFRLEIQDITTGQSLFATESYPLAGSPLVGALGFRSGRLGSGPTMPYFSWKIRNGERFFGLGEKWNRVEKTGSRATIWASDTCGSNSNDLSYKSLPYLLSSEGWGCFLHSSFRSFWEVGSFSYVSGSCASEDANLDAFFFFGDGFKSLIERYTALTGRPQPVPDWAMGLWMSRCQYRNRAEVEEAIDGLIARDIPADVIHVDPLWMKTHYYFKIGVDACDFVRNDADFPDLPGLMRKWAAKGFRTCLWVNPYLPDGSPIYEEAAERGYLLRSLRGGLARLSHGEPVGMVDFSHSGAREWWKEKLRELLHDGAAVIKPDYGDRVPEDAIFSDGRTGRELHNLYLFWFTEACYQACEEVHGYGFVWRRAGYIGSQRYPGTWAGDTRSTWEEMLASLRGGLSAGFNGEAFWSSDIGGFTGPEPSPELFIRWAQLGLLSPLCRFHGANSPREPWYFGEKAVEVVRHYAKLRYRLLPYFRRVAGEAYASGIPLMRHLHLECPGEPGTEFIDDQFFLGPDLLVAPVFTAGALHRQVYFPSGEWEALEENKGPVYEGGRWHEVAAPLERIPLFHRAGAIVF